MAKFIILLLINALVLNSCNSISEKSVKKEAITSLNYTYEFNKCLYIQIDSSQLIQFEKVRMNDKSDYDFGPVDYVNFYKIHLNKKQIKQIEKANSGTDSISNQDIVYKRIAPYLNKDLVRFNNNKFEVNQLNNKLIKVNCFPKYLLDNDTLLIWWITM